MPDLGDHSRSFGGPYDCSAPRLTRTTLSDFIIESGGERAERLLADRDRFTLDEEQWAAFNSALDRPAEVRPELVELFARTAPE